ncbi:MAG: ABC transporter substrate-binding protein [Novosphingobium sp.]
MLPLTAVLLVSACSDRDERLVRVSLIGDPPGAASRRAMPAEVRSATAEGLVGFDEEGRVVPALADRWIVTEDGQSYIFRLRNGTWPGGQPITGESAAGLLRQALRTLRGTPLALDLAAVDEVRGMAARVVEIRLSSPLPDLLALLAQPELGLTRKGMGSGPMKRDQQGTVAELAPIPPEKLGLPVEEGWHDRVRVVRLRRETAKEAVSRFDEGYADVVLGGRADTLPLVKTAGISRGTVRLDPVIGLFGLQFERAFGFFATTENREALALAIDREALLAPFKVARWTPTTRLVAPDAADAPPGVGERWAGFSLIERRQVAAARIARWQADAGALAPLRIALPATPGGTLLYNGLRGDFAAVGLAVRRVGPDEPADLRLIDQVARYGRATWFLNQLSCGAGRPVCSKEADALLARARDTVDPAERAALLAEAENRITAANGFIPFAPPLRWSLVRADIAGFVANPWAVHPLLPLALATR